MDLYKEILINVLQSEKSEVTFPNLGIDAEEIIKNKCYETILKIKEILENDKYDDKECYMKIEAIVCAFEDGGIGIGARHDW